MSDEYVTGTIKWFDKDKGFGFIKMPGNVLDVFIHANQLRKSGIHNTPQDGEAVRFNIGQGPKGAFAINISKVNGNASP
jgi:CspA family cold shock protein